MGVDDDPDLERDVADDEFVPRVLRAPASIGGSAALARSAPKSRETHEERSEAEAAPERERRMRLQVARDAAARASQGSVARASNASSGHDAKRPPASTLREPALSIARDANAPHASTLRHAPSDRASATTARVTALGSDSRLTARPEATAFAARSDAASGVPLESPNLGALKLNERALSRVAPASQLASALATVPEIAPLAPGVPRGRVIELEGGAANASSSAAVQIALASQREGDPVAWIQPRGGDLFPPDLAAAGLDLAALLVVHAPTAEGGVGLAKAAELALRTGAFGAIVIDYTSMPPPRGDAWLGRLSSLAREHDCRCVLLGPSNASSSLGPLVALRLKIVRRRVRPGVYALSAEIRKDKAGTGASLDAPPIWRAPEGMP